MSDTWPTRQKVITTMQEVIKQAHRAMDAAQTGDPLPDAGWGAALVHAAEARQDYRQTLHACDGSCGLVTCPGYRE